MRSIDPVSDPCVCTAVCDDTTGSLVRASSGIARDMRMCKSVAQAHSVSNTLHLESAVDAGAHAQGHNCGSGTSEPVLGLLLDTDHI